MCKTFAVSFSEPFEGAPGGGRLAVLCKNPEDGVGRGLGQCRAEPVREVHDHDGDARLGGRRRVVPVEALAVARADVGGFDEGARGCGRAPNGKWRMENGE